MMLPSSLKNFAEWTFVGPMGPDLPEALTHHPILAVDGGANYTSNPDVWVGDADSYLQEIKAPHIIKHPVHKSESDLALALSLFKEHILYKFHFWGFLGERKDHELFNLGEAYWFLEEHPESEIIFYDAKGRENFHLLGAGFWKFHHVGLFSLGTLKKVAVKLTGDCEFPIPHLRHVLALSSFGLSNVGKGDMTLETHGPIFLHFPEGKS